MGCPQGTSEPAAGEIIVNPGAAADDALATVAMYRLLIATTQTIRAARRAANRILFLCMGACFPLPPRRAPRVLNAGESLGRVQQAPAGWGCEPAPRAADARLRGRSQLSASRRSVIRRLSLLRSRRVLSCSSPPCR